MTKNNKETRNNLQDKIIGLENQTDNKNRKKTF